MKDIEKDKRLIIPKDDFEEEASEGLGRLSREEAEEDLRELKGRMERRISRRWLMWLPAAAAVVILLVASAVFVSLFRERGTELSGVAVAEEVEMTLSDEAVFTDTALIAMAEPIQISTTSISVLDLGYGQDAAGSAAESKSGVRRELADRHLPSVVVEDDEMLLSEVIVMSEEEVVAEEAVPAKAVAREADRGKVVTEEAVAEEVIVEAYPTMQMMAGKKRVTAKDEATAAAKDKQATAGGAPTAADNRSTTGTVNTGAAVGAETKSGAPAGGYEEFTKWLQENTVYPEGVEPRVQQEVVVTFRVRTDSTVYDLKTESRAGDLFTREAFRLIREGPKWVPPVRNGQAVDEEVRVTIVFR